MFVGQNFGHQAETSTILWAWNKEYEMKANSTADGVQTQSCIHIRHIDAEYITYPDRRSIVNLTLK